LHRSVKRNVVMGLAALAVAAFAGGAYAATQNSGPTTRQAFLNDVAKRLHVTPQQLSSAVDGATTDQLQAEVAAGRLTQAQANALEQKLKNGGAAGLLPLVPGLVAPRPFAVPKGRFGPGGPGGPGPLGFRGFGLGLSDAATYLGLTNAELFQQLQSGKSLAQIATAKGKTVAGLESAMTAQIKKALDAAVAKKAISAAREKQILSRYASGLSQRVNQKGLMQRGPRAFFRGPGGPGGPGGSGGSGQPFWGPPNNGKNPPTGTPPKGTPKPQSPSAPAPTPGAAPAQLFMPAPTA
jgi:hypothetical protein